MMTPAELNITPEVFEALGWVRDRLRDGSIVHVYNPEFGNGRHGLNMNWTVFDGCGTVACIGGWVWCRVNVIPGDGAIPEYMLNAEVATTCDGWVTGAPEQLNALFYPVCGRKYLQDITPAEAAQAIDNFLDSGKPRWDEVCGDEDDA